MRKEIIFAIFFGVLFGIIIAFGFLRANKAIKESKSQISTENNIPKADDTPDKVANSQITLVKPNELEVIEGSKTVVSGITIPDTTLLISYEENDIIIKTDGNGAFEEEIKLNPLLNKIHINTIEEGKITHEKLLYLIYSSEFFKQSDELEDTDNQASEGADITEKVEKKLDIASNRPIFYSGTITDKTEDTIQIKNESDTIEQISLIASTSYLDTRNDNKEIVSGDVAIGDNIIALGYMDENRVLIAYRIFTSDIYEDNRKILLGKLTAVKNKTATFVDSDSHELTFDFGKRWNGPEINELETDASYIVVAVLDEGKWLIRTIEKI